MATVALLLFGLRGCHSQLDEVRGRATTTVETKTFRIGESEVYARVTHREGNSLTLVQLHEDEVAAGQAGALFVEKHAGTFIQLSHAGTRRVRFSLQRVDYSFDPNRIFTEVGIQKTLRSQTTVTPEAYAAVHAFSDEFVRLFRLNRQAALLAVHNNEPGGYSIRSYLPGAPLEADAGEVSVNPEVDPDDFFYVTDRRHFDLLKQKGCNVVLQHPSTPEDDGSLSIFAGRRGIPYINVETEIGRPQEQLRMLELAADIAGGQYADPRK